MSHKGAFQLLTAGVSFKKEDWELLHPKTKPARPSRKRAREADPVKEEPPIETEGLTLISGVKWEEKSRVKPEEKPKNQQHLEEMQALRHKHRIRVEGNAIPDPVSLLSELFPRYECPQVLLDNMDALGFSVSTPIQMQAIPALLEDRELLGCAPTGSGKTLAFMIPILCYVMAHQGDGIRALVVSPTRELAHQTHQEFLRVSEGSGVLIEYLKSGKAPKCDVLICTPMRLIRMSKKHKDALGLVQRVILDEADKLFEMEFLGQIDQILSVCAHKKRIVSLFSATMPPQVEELARTILRDPIRVIIGHRNVTASDVKQRLVFVGREEGKLLTMRQMLRSGLQPPILVFVQSKDRAKDLYDELLQDQFNVGAIHSDKTQSEREEVVRQFRTGKIWILIATDLFARGMDFKGVNCVVNYDFPQSTVSYVHRIGRTGRAGRPGEAITFFTEDDAEFLRPIANILRDSGCEVPDYMFKIEKPNKKRRKKIEKRPIHRVGVAAGTADDQEYYRKAIKKRQKHKR